MALFEKFYLEHDLYLADGFQYYFTENFFKYDSKPAYINPLASSRADSIILKFDNYMETLQMEDVILKDRSYSSDNSFEFPFQDYVYYFGPDIPYNC